MTLSKIVLKFQLDFLKKNRQVTYKRFENRIARLLRRLMELYCKQEVAPVDLVVTQQSQDLQYLSDDSKNSPQTVSISVADKKNHELIKQGIRDKEHSSHVSKICWSYQINIREESYSRGIINKMENLRFLKLDFERSCQITDSEIRELNEEMKGMKNLQSLSLNFYWCVKITDNGLKELKEEMNQMKIPIWNHED